VRKLLVVVLLGGLAVFLFWNSTYYSVLRLSQALASGDLDGVAERADLTKFSELPVDISLAMTAAGMKEAVGTFGAELVRLLGGAVGAGIKQVGGQLAAQKLRGRILERDLIPLLGGFRPNTGLGWYGGIESTSAETAVLRIVGTCDDRLAPGRIETTVGIDLMLVRGPYLGLPHSWRAMGVEATSIRKLINDCAFHFGP
jgi:hypothetical protein